MSANIVCKGLAASFGARELFSGLDLEVAPGDTVGLVGPNGTGKSTLLRILAGLRPADAGTVTLAPKTATVGYLAQEPDRIAGESVRMLLTRRTGVAAAEAEMNRTADELASGVPGADDAYSTALERWLALGGADLEERTAAVVAELGLDVDLDMMTTALSGGQAARAGLAALLLSRYDAFLLDEPTNDLDIDGLDHLEDFVQSLDAPTVLVSHDREFLTRTVSKVVEIDRSLRRIAVYGGSYEAYLEERSTARRHAAEAYAEFADRRAELEARARRQRAWMQKGVKTARRKAKDRDKMGRAFRVEATEKQAAKVRQTERMIERLGEVEAPRKEWKLQFKIAAAARSGDVVAALRGAVAERGSFRLGPVDLQLDVRDRIAITGPNGGGKSTLLALILGRLAPTAGTATLGSGVAIGEVDQARESFVAESPTGEVFAGCLPDWSTADVRTLLAKFGIGAEFIRRSAASLSPGERTRVAMALLQARGCNLLVLDEPTNHLDLEAIEQLEQALDSFDGTVLLVSHDRRMLDNVRLTRRWHVEDGRVAEIAAD
ncbi:MAG: ABC-F family ATP-binding cassette domain-containing protein [Planctomycetes bacterium]|nr:ABC-F family ATP-binding cassette domain-containing protein [Planctomycetota bacterium]